jgi:hypothetical protein
MQQHFRLSIMPSTEDSQIWLGPELVYSICRQKESFGGAPGLAIAATSHGLQETKDCCQSGLALDPSEGEQRLSAYVEKSREQKVQR